MFGYEKIFLVIKVFVMICGSDILSSVIIGSKEFFKIWCFIICILDRFFV